MQGEVVIASYYKTEINTTYQHWRKLFWAVRDKVPVGYFSIQGARGSYYCISSQGQRIKKLQTYAISTTSFNRHEIDDMRKRGSTNDMGKNGAQQIEYNEGEQINRKEVKGIEYGAIV